MNTIRFQTVIGEDQVIRPPKDVKLPQGHAEVTIVPQPQSVPPKSDSLRAMIERLARAAEAVEGHELPPDLAENHDHYLYGTPKGIDRQ
jgi:hypothetical protein